LHKSYPLRTAPEGSLSSVAVEGMLTSNPPARDAGAAVAAVFDDPMALNLGFFLGAPEVEAVSDMDWISLLAWEALGFSWPPVSLVSCFISLRRCVEVKVLVRVVVLIDR